MAKRAKTPQPPPPWKVGMSAHRVDVMHSRVHGTKSRRTERRQAKQRGWTES